MYKHFLIATDGSELATRSLEQGIALAAALGARVTILTIIRPFHAVAPAEVMIAFPTKEYEKSASEHADRLLERAMNLAVQAGVACAVQSSVHDDPWQAIVDAATNAGCDLIVVGSHGRTGLAKLVLGSETQKVLTHSTIPVLVTR